MLRKFRSLLSVRAPCYGTFIYNQIGQKARSVYTLLNTHAYFFDVSIIVGWSCAHNSKSSSKSSRKSSLAGGRGSTSNEELDIAEKYQSRSTELAGSEDLKEGDTYQLAKPSVQGFAKEAFILLNQERYTEHEAPVILCEASPQGSVVATVDAHNCLKVWTVSPSPTTKATLVLEAAPTCLSWDQDGDCEVLFLGFEGKLSQLNIESLSFTHFEPKGDYTRVLTLATMSEMLACSFGDSDKSSKEGSLVLLNTKKFDADVSTLRDSTISKCPCLASSLIQHSFLISPFLLFDIDVYIYSFSFLLFFFSIFISFFVPWLPKALH